MNEQYCEGFGGSGGGCPCPVRLCRGKQPLRGNSASTGLTLQTFDSAEFFKNRKVFKSAKSSKTANFSFLCGVPQTFHFSAEPPHSFGHRKVFKNRKLFIFLRYRKLFSRRQAGLGPPGSSLWPVARAAQRMISATVKRLREQLGVVRPEMNRVPRTM